MGNHITYGITQCYLPPGNSDFPALTAAEAGTRFSAPDECKAQLTWVVVISRDSLPAKDSVIAENLNHDRKSQVQCPNH